MINLKEIQKIFAKYPEIKVAYLFGSQAKEQAGVLSDYDFAVYLHPLEKNKAFEIRYKLLDEISKFLKTDSVDVVVLNLSRNSELKYRIITDGKLVFEVKPFKVSLEPKILNEYFDYKIGLLKYGLTLT